MSDIQPRNPPHGVTSEMILTGLIEHYGWEEPGEIIIKCFIHEPGIRSSLRFLRKTPRAREKVEDQYLCCPCSKD